MACVRSLIGFSVLSTPLFRGRWTLVYPSSGCRLINASIERNFPLLECFRVRIAKILIKFQARIKKIQLQIALLEAI